jgi:RNA polymerase sigma-70 factor (ECF subfamily)
LKRDAVSPLKASLAIPEEGNGDSAAERGLVERAASGDRDAYRILVEKYQNRVFSLVLSMVKSREDAEDIVQESFVKAYLSLKNFRGESSFYTWIYRVAYNMAIDFQRRNTRRNGVVTEPRSNNGEKEVAPVEGVASDGNPEDTVQRKELAVTLDAAMAHLSEEHRAVIMLREVDGMSYSEIADVLGVSQGTVMSRIHYAKKYLQKALKEFEN